MAKRSLLEIEDALVAKLKPLVDSHHVRQVGTYNGDLDIERFVSFVQEWPAVLVHYNGSTFEDYAQRRAETMEFVVFACDRHESEQSEARRGGLTNPGSYNLLDAVAGLLEGKKVIATDDVAPCERLHQQSEMQGKALSIYSARYAIKIVYLVNLE